ncbi:MAG: CDP-alcohol phosphatidyltransferase family protein [Oscillospiraceae bacterium]|nr:CDP-alcohol phosphatidyltransferase family protein [Oscillospiraceae bacterium]
MLVDVKLTVPNLLSLLRILLIPVFVVLYLSSSAENSCPAYWAFGVLFLSGVTDFLDGIIARKFNQITDFGKLLDPIADKLTQVAVVVALAVRHNQLFILAAICVLKELIQGIGGLLLLRKGDEVRGARWFGKAATFVFYGVMIAIVLIPDEYMSAPLLYGLIALVGAAMLVAFIGYMKTFMTVRKDLK